MTNDELSIENQLKELRREKKISQEELAKALGLSRQSVIAIEQGKSMPSLPVAVSLCRFFETNFEEIFQFEREIVQMLNEDKNDEIGNIINIVHSKAPADHPQRLGMEKEKTMGNEMEPWRPFREVVSLRDAMDRLFEDSVITPKGGAGVAMPRIDIKDKKDSIVVKAELPGMKEDEIDVEISDGVMTISGEKKEEKETDEEGYYYKESHTGTFSRSFTLPSDVKEDSAEAEMKNGVLRITLPKIEPKKATKVKIAGKK